MKQISRKDFFKLGSLAAGAAISFNRGDLFANDFPVADRLGRIAVGRVDIKSSPDYEAPTVDILYEDTVIPWYQEVIGAWPFRNNQRWIETEGGYVWGPNIQPVRNEPNQPLGEIPEGMDGFWVEVTVPWVNAVMENPPGYSTWWNLQNIKNLPPRFYYMQVLWVDQIKTGSSGNIIYRVNERYGNPGDLLWAPAEAFRPISEPEITPIHPEAENKQIIVDVTDSHQTLSCLENGREVYFCRISSGKVPNTTPLTAIGSDGFNIWRKLASVQMSGGTNQAGWMIPGIGWVSFFYNEGVAIHSTFWHNNFGEPSSHGCVNAAPEDAKWIYRWASPVTPFPEGDITVSGDIGTPVKVVEY